MDNTDFKKLMERSAKIRERYHELERSNHNTIWSIEEDALAFLTDAGLVGRNIMSEQNRWPKKDTGFFFFFSLQFFLDVYEIDTQ